MISLRAKVGQSTLLLLVTLFALYSNRAVFSFHLSLPTSCPTQTAGGT